MAAVGNDESGVEMSAEEISSTQSCQSSEALAEWRSSEQVENGTPSTSPPYWDSDDDDDGGPKPSELYGKYTWKIEKFSQIKRELRSSAFEVGGYKWYILIYPQGCDVCNHLSLFLCVANHDKLLPGWSHFAQFTIAVVNKEPRKSKYSDTLHRFWKKEHDWGWKKFMELSKVYDGFIDSDTLIIKAQVQVIREKADRPFRCLDCQYRRELVRVYLTNVEQICRRFVEERRSKLAKLIEDKARWPSFCAFWLGIDQNARRHMSREKKDVILKVVVKHFFIEKEVTSTLVMDSLYSGLKALEGQSNKDRTKLLGFEESTAPVIRVEKDMFVLVDDILVLLERAAMEPLPPKDEKGPQNRKDGNSGEDFNKDSIERDERRLTELGRRTVEIFVLAHIFSNKIEVAHQEAVALKRQEELIREEEAAWLAESEQKAKRAMNMKEKKSKKKQAKQKRNNRKGKDKGKEEKAGAAVQNRNNQENVHFEKMDTVGEQAQPVVEKSDIPDSVSDVSDSVTTEVLQPDSEDRDASPVNWDTDASEIQQPAESSSSVGILSSVQNGVADKRSSSVVDDSSSTCSTDSIPSVVMNGPYNGDSFTNYRTQKSGRGKNRRGKVTYDGYSWAFGKDSQPSTTSTDVRDSSDVPQSSKASESKSVPVVSTQNGAKRMEPENVKKEVNVSLQRTPSVKDSVDVGRNSNEKVAIPPSPIRSSIVQPKPIYKPNTIADSTTVRRASQSNPQPLDKFTSPMKSSQVSNVPKPETQKAATSKPAEKPLAQSVPAMSRPSSAPLVPASKPSTSVVSVTQTAPFLARSVSAAGRLGPDPSPATHSHGPQSYRNAIIGNNVASSSSSYPSSSTAGVSSSSAHPQSSSVASPSMFVNQSSDRVDTNKTVAGFSLAMSTAEAIHNGPRWIESRDANQSTPSGRSYLNDTPNIPFYQSVNRRSVESLSTEFSVGTSGRQMQGLVLDEFPHLDIINDLLDDEHAVDDATSEGTRAMNLYSRQFSFPGEVGISGDVGASASSPFGRTHSFHDDGFQGGYSPFGGFIDSRDYIQQGGPLTYQNGQIDGLIPNQWQIAGSEMSSFGVLNTEADAYTYYSPDYSNLVSGVNGYSLFRPSSGH